MLMTEPKYVKRLSLFAVFLFGPFLPTLDSDNSPTSTCPPTGSNMCLCVRGLLGSEVHLGPKFKVSQNRQPDLSPEFQLLLLVQMVVMVQSSG